MALCVVLFLAAGTARADDPFPNAGFGVRPQPRVGMARFVSEEVRIRLDRDECLFRARFSFEAPEDADERPAPAVMPIEVGFPLDDQAAYSLAVIRIGGQLQRLWSMPATIPRGGRGVDVVWRTWMLDFAAEDSATVETRFMVPVRMPAEAPDRPYRQLGADIVAEFKRKGWETSPELTALGEIYVPRVTGYVFEDHFWEAPVGRTEVAVKDPILERQAIRSASPDALWTEDGIRWSLRNGAEPGRLVVEYNPRATVKEELSAARAASGAHPQSESLRALCYYLITLNTRMAEAKGPGDMRVRP